MAAQLNCSKSLYYRVLTIREIEDLDQMEIKEDEEESGEEGETSCIPPKEAEMVLIRRVLHASEAPLEASQREQSFHSRCKVANVINVLGIVSFFEIFFVLSV